MTIEIISMNTVKITLTEPDMSDYDIDYQSLDKKNPDTRRVLLELLEVVREEKDIDLTDEKLYVEVFPKSGGGCLMYISMLNTRVRAKRELYCEIVCEVEDKNDLTALCKGMFHSHSHLIRCSELYLSQSGYRLIVSTFSKAEERLCHIISEYGKVLGKGEILAAATREHCEEIIPSEAVEKLSKAKRS